MRTQPMSYKSYVWPFNPQKIEMKFEKNIREIKIPLSASILQDLGRGKRMITGKGEFIGSSSMTEFNRLAEVFAQSGNGMLKLTWIQPFLAVFSSLKMIGEPKPDCVIYEFEFLESTDSNKTPSGVPDTEIYVCAGGESLWSVANCYATTVDQLKALNPMIRWPNFLKAGQKVVLP